MMKIATLCSVYDVPFIPHGATVPVNAHVSLALSPTVCPYIEYLIKWNELRQFFFKNPVKPVNGAISLTDAPGIGVELDENKITASHELSWS